MPATAKGFRYPAGTDLISQGDDAIHNLASDVDGFAGWLPVAGAAGAVLAKTGPADYAAGWTTPHWVPAGGGAGAVLAKNSATDYDAVWGTPHYVPAGGGAGQVLTKNTPTDYDAGWATPTGGGGGGVTGAQRVHLRRSATLNLPAGGTPTPAITFDLEDWDTDAMHDLVTNTSRITIKTAGVYVIYHQGTYTGGGGNGALFVRKNGAGMLAPSTWNATKTGGSDTPAGTGGWTAAWIGQFAINDYLELVGYSSTTAPTTTPEFGAYRLA